MPRTFGDSLIHKSHVDVMVEVNNPLPEMKTEEPNDVENAIGKLVAENLVEDGATLQMGRPAASLLLSFHYGYTKVFIVYKL